MPGREAPSHPRTLSYPEYQGTWFYSQQMDHSQKRGYNLPVLPQRADRTHPVSTGCQVGA